MGSDQSVGYLFTIRTAQLGIVSYHTVVFWSWWLTMTLLGGGTVWDFSKKRLSSNPRPSKCLCTLALLHLGTATPMCWCNHNTPSVTQKPECTFRLLCRQNIFRVPMFCVRARVTGCQLAWGSHTWETFGRLKEKIIFNLQNPMWHWHQWLDWDGRQSNWRAQPGE